MRLAAQNQHHNRGQPSWGEALYLLADRCHVVVVHRVSMTFDGAGEGVAYSSGSGGQAHVAVESAGMSQDTVTDVACLCICKMYVWRGAIVQ